jgi:hypothetical protein
MSAQSNWNNFRNERYAPPGEHMEETEFDTHFLTKLPTSGVVEFDYVSTTRPIINYKQPQATNTHGIINGGHGGHENHTHGHVEGAHDGHLPLLDHPGHVDDGGGSTVHNENSLLSLSIDDMSLGEDSMTGVSQSSLHSPSQVTGSTSMFGSQLHGASIASSVSHVHDEVNNPFYGRALTDEEFDSFMKQLELDRGIRISKSLSIYKLLELQIAASKHYFSVQRVLKILDVLSDDRSTQARAVVCMFSRIIDLYNFDVVMRHLDQPVRDEVYSCIGHLNCFNALKPGGDYIISLKCRDCRILVLMLLGIAECESNPLTKDKYSDMSMVDVYQHKSRLLDTSSLQSLVLRFTYNDFSEQQVSAKERADINWDFRRNNINATLLGTKPVDRNQFRIISMYKEMDAANTLSTGPIETQYINHIKQRGHRRILHQAGMSAGANGASMPGATK